jgi:hypothetical protein
MTANASIAKDVVINVASINDDMTGEALDNIRAYFADALLPNFRGTFAVYTLSTNGTFVLPHNLGFMPQDVIQTANTGGVVVWHYGNFDKTNIEFAITGVVVGTPCVVRAFIGTYGGS